MAADPTGYSLDINSLQRIGRVVREVETNKQLPPTTNRRSRFNGPLVEGIMLENLDGTNDPNVPTKARMQIKTGLHANDEWADDPQPSILTIWNRTTTAVSIDQVVFAKEIYPDRWHLIVGGSGGTHEVWATIVSAECEEYTNKIKYVMATPTYYTGGCDANAIPGIDYYGMIRVEAVCPDEWTAFWTKEQLEEGKILRATYMKPLTGACEWVWLLDGVCGQPECA